jgi:hypothetical protein
LDFHGIVPVLIRRATEFFLYEAAQFRIHLYSAQRRGGGVFEGREYRITRGEMTAGNHHGFRAGIEGGHRPGGDGA